jgi:prolyl-tRNA synthetase
LIGNPVIVVVGKSLEQGNVEVRVRRTGDKQELPLVGAARAIASLVDSL